MVEMQNAVGPGMFSVIVDDLMNRMSPYSPAFYTCCALTSIGDHCAVVKQVETNEEMVIPADYVVLSLGVNPRNIIAEDFEKAFENVVRVGDNVQSGRIPHAMKDAFIKSRVFLKDNGRDI